MKPNTWKAIVDALLYVCMLNVTFIGILLGFFIGKGSSPARPKVLWGLHRHEWGDLHLWFSLALIALVLIHLILQISWMRSTSRRLLRLHWGLALVLLTAVAGLTLYGLAQVKLQGGDSGEQLEQHEGHQGEGERGGGRGRGRRGGG